MTRNRTLYIAANLTFSGYFRTWNHRKVFQTEEQQDFVREVISEKLADFGGELLSAEVEPTMVSFIFTIGAGNEPMRVFRTVRRHMVARFKEVYPHSPNASTQIVEGSFMLQTVGTPITEGQIEAYESTLASLRVAPPR